MVSHEAKGPESEARLYRDDIGAALERVRRLEEENQSLRAEIAQIKAHEGPVLPSPYRIGTIALCIATMAVGASLAFSNGGSAPPSPPDVVVVQAPLPMPPPVLAPAPTLPRPPIANSR